MQCFKILARKITKLLEEGRKMILGTSGSKGANYYQMIIQSKRKVLAC